MRSEDDETVEAAVQVVDSHVHFWDPARMDYPWLAAVPALHRPYRPRDLDTGGHELAAAVFVEAGRADGDAAREVDWVEELAADWPVLRAVVAHAPLEHGAGAAPRLAELAGRPLVRGVRRNVQDEPAGFATTDAFVAGVRTLARYGLTFDLCVRHHQLAEVTTLARRAPDVTIVLDHLGKPPVAAARPDPWRADLARLAAAPNVVCKLSGLATEAAPGHTTADLVPYLAHALAVFGADRCMFGGDWPVSTLAVTYPDWLGVVTAALAGRPESERSAVFGGTARRVYRIGS
ncbi:amidohydrolase family protein [Polymorphospora sp. NPDC050346]|uniref:amidohydrolase family protein n=1 Tax=Polymorphospora sp. NPDC050346 TaxID=3155780 RepID=UPI0033D0CEB5